MHAIYKIPLILIVAITNVCPRQKKGMKASELT